MIYFFSEEIELPQIDQAIYARWLNNIAEVENKSIDNVNYIFCSDPYLLEINKKHLQHDYFTDIITFPLGYDPIAADIFISVERVVENAKNLKLEFDHELQRVIVHGLLHMMGYDDKDESSQKLMRNKENYYINQLIDLLK